MSAALSVGAVGPHPVGDVLVTTLAASAIIHPEEEMMNETDCPPGFVEHLAGQRLTRSPTPRPGPGADHAPVRPRSCP
jgi:hypothetical protein